jgi:hypothetical protein
MEAEVMTKSLKVLSMVAVAALLAAPGALALDTMVLKVDVPFDFVVDNQLLPRGEYRVTRTQGTDIVKVCSKDGRHALATLSTPLPAEVESGGELVFHKRGNKRFLRTIRTEQGGAYVPECRAEKEAARTATDSVLVGMR